MNHQLLLYHQFFLLLFFKIVSGGSAVAADLTLLGLADKGGADCVNERSDWNPFPFSIGGKKKSSDNTGSCLCFALTNRGQWCPFTRAHLAVLKSRDWFSLCMQICSAQNQIHNDVSTEPPSFLPLLVARVSVASINKCHISPICQQTQTGPV